MLLLIYVICVAGSVNAHLVDICVYFIWFVYEYACVCLFTHVQVRQDLEYWPDMTPNIVAVSYEYKCAMAEL